MSYNPIVLRFKFGSKHLSYNIEKKLPLPKGWCGVGGRYNLYSGTEYFEGPIESKDKTMKVIESFYKNLSKEGYCTDVKVFFKMNRVPDSCLEKNLVEMNIIKRKRKELEKIDRKIAKLKQEHIISEWELDKLVHKKVKIETEMLMCW